MAKIQFLLIDVFDPRSKDSLAQSMKLVFAYIFITYNLFRSDSVFFLIVSADSC